MDSSTPHTTHLERHREERAKFDAKRALLDAVLDVIEVAQELPKGESIQRDSLLFVRHFTGADCEACDGHGSAGEYDCPDCKGTSYEFREDCPCPVCEAVAQVMEVTHG